MMWFTKTFRIDGYFDIAEQFDQHFLGLGAPRNMILLGENILPNKRIFLGLPNADLLPHYPGFESIQRSDLPVSPQLLNGHHDVYTELFPSGGEPHGDTGIVRR